MPFKGLSVAEAYLKGDLVVCVLFEPEIGDDCWAATVAFKGHVGNGASTGERDPIDHNSLSCGQEHDVLVRDVEQVEVEQIVSIPSFVGLYLIKDAADNSFAGAATRFGMSLDGTFKVLPAFLFGEGKLDVPVDAAAIGFDQQTVSVVKGGPEVMNCIAQNSRCVSGKRSPNGRRFPSITIATGDHSLSAFTDVRPENVFKVRDVIFGPFGL